MPDELFEEAKTLFAQHPDYTMLKSVMPEPRSLIHTYPFFKLQGTVFTFFIVPAHESSIDCSPNKCERSHSGISYPKLEHFAQGLLDAQKYHDLEDLVDGMDLDDVWGVANLQLGRIPIDSINRKNEVIRESLPGLPGLIASLSTVPDGRRSWTAAVQGKRSRMFPKRSEAIYATRFRLVGSPDPRLDRDRQV